MKNLNKNLLFKICSLALIVVLTVIVNACKKPTEGINIIVGTNLLFPAPTVIKFSNADSTSANKLTNFPVTISGPGAAYVQMSSGGTKFQATNGMIALALTKDAHPSASNPITFTVSASISNFAPILQNITITQDKLSIYSIKALEYSSPTAGTTVINSMSTPLVSGIMPATYLLTTDKTSTMTEQAMIQFPTGTAMQDANGATISGANTLNFSLVQYGTTTKSSLAALPGGTSTTTALNADGTAIAGSVNFVTAGLLQMNLDASGVAVKKFSQPVNISIELNANQTNFATGVPIKVGDVIPYWSLNETTGQWKNEGKTTVVLDGNGKLSAPIAISHLSCWSIGWSWGAVGAYGTCSSSLNVTINTSDPSFKGGPYNVSLQTPDGTYLGGVQGVTISNGNVVTLTSVPNVGQVKVVVSGGIPNISVQSSLFDACGAGNVAITVPVQSTDNTVNVAVSITGICNGKDLTVLPSATFELYQQTGSTYTDAGTLQLVNGKGTTGLQAGKMYYLTTTYGGTNYTTDPFSVSKSDFSINNSSLSIAAKYDASSNTLNLSGSIPVNCN